MIRYLPAFISLSTIALGIYFVGLTFYNGDFMWSVLASALLVNAVYQSNLLAGTK